MKTPPPRGLVQYQPRFIKKRKEKGGVPKQRGCNHTKDGKHPRRTWVCTREREGQSEVRRQSIRLDGT